MPVACFQCAAQSGWCGAVLASDVEDVDRLSAQKHWQLVVGVARSDDRVDRVELDSFPERRRDDQARAHRRGVVVTAERGEHDMSEQDGSTSGCGTERVRT